MNTTTIWSICSGLIIAAVAGMLGCKSHSDKPAPAAGIESLQSGTWQLTKLGGQEVPAGADITLELLPDDKLAGSTGVNRYFGTYKSLGAGKLGFSPLGSTRKAGPPDAMKREADFLAAMQLVGGYRMHDGSLVLTDGQSDLMTFRR